METYPDAANEITAWTAVVEARFAGTMLMRSAERSKMPIR